MISQPVHMMATDRVHYQKLWARSRSLAAPEDADRFFADLESSYSSSKLDVSAFHALENSGFSNLKLATASDADAASEIILNHLLPKCLHEHDHSSVAAASAMHRLRELLREWIEQYPDEQRWSLRERALSATLNAAETDQAEPPLWTISAIGFRSPEAMRVLWRLASRDDNIGDIAVSTLASLGVSAADRGRLISEIQVRLQTGDPSRLDYALQELPDPAWLNALAARMNSGNPGLLASNLLTRIADAAPHNESTQESVWSILQSAAHVNHSRRDELLFGNTLGPWCNLSSVVTTLGRLITQPEMENGRYLVYLRLEECVRPRQLDGWSSLAAPELLAVMRDDATKNSQNTSRWMTQEQRVKDHAWHTALSTGSPNVMEWLDEAVTNEVSPYARRSVMGTAACLAIATWPDAIRQWITDRISLDHAADRPEIFTHIGATEVARSAATISALDTLLDAGLTLEGYVLRSTAEAVAEVAAWLVRKGHTTVIRMLFEKFASSDSERSRSLVISGLRELACNRLLERSHLTALLQIADMSPLSDHLRARIVDAIGFLATQEDAHAVLQLVDIARRSQSTSEVRKSAAIALARAGLWRTEFADSLGVNIDGSDGSPDGFLISILVQQQPSEFARAAASLIREGGGESVYQLLNALARTAENREISVPDEIVQATIARINDTQNRNTAELYIFDSLARIAPGIAATYDWARLWTQWMPDARAALADALGRQNAQIRGEAREGAVRQLALLLRDAAYPVRRSAARALALIEPGALNASCAEWIRSGQTDLRRRAAEASGWLEPDRADTLDCAILRDSLVDPEPSVRETAKRAQADARRRGWAAYCLRQLLLRIDDANAYVLKSYPFGRALAKLGDDTSLVELHEMANQPNLPPNVRHWFKQLLEEMGKQWGQTTREWPEPWLPWSGTVEEFEGDIVLNDKPQHARLSLWRRHRESPEDISGWGGAVRLLDAPENRLPFFGTGSSIQICTHQRIAAEALVTSWTTEGTALIVGNGRYPDSIVVT